MHYRAFEHNVTKNCNALSLSDFIIFAEALEQHNCLGEM